MLKYLQTSARIKIYLCYIGRSIEGKDSLWSLSVPRHTTIFSLENKLIQQKLVTVNHKIIKKYI